MHNMVKQFGIGAQVICAAAEYHVYVHHASCLFYWFLFFIVLASVGVHWGKSIAVKSHASRFNRDVKTYKALQVLNCTSNECLRSLAWPSFVVSNLVTYALAIYISIRLFQGFDPVLAVIYPFYTVVWLLIDVAVYPLNAKTEEYSTQFKQYWSGKRLTALESRMLKALRPTRVEVSSMSFIEKTTLLTILGIVVDWTVNALLMI